MRAKEEGEEGEEEEGMVDALNRQLDLPLHWSRLNDFEANILKQDLKTIIVS